MSIAVVIPAYNEARTIADVVRRVLRYAGWIIVVDDGSNDGTREQLIDLQVTVLSHAHNRGKGASLWHGINFALERGASTIVTLDADGQHCPEDLPRLMRASRRHPDRLIIAARLIRRDQVPGPRRFANGMADFWISWAAGYPIQDTQSGFRLYPVRVLETVRAAHDRRHGFVFESEVLIDAVRRDCYTLSIPVNSIYHQKARASYYRPLMDTMRIVRMVAWKLISKGLYPQGLLRFISLSMHRRFNFSARFFDVRRKI